MDEFIAFYSGPMSYKDLIDMQGENKTPPEAEGDDYQSPPTETLTVKKMNQMQREIHKCIELLIGIQLAADLFIKRRRRLMFNFLLTNMSREFIRHPQQVLLPNIKISFFLCLLNVRKGKLR
jgi:hypothetical protein